MHHGPQNLPSWSKNRQQDVEWTAEICLGHKKSHNIQLEEFSEGYLEDKHRQFTKSRRTISIYLKLKDYVYLIKH